MTITALAAPEPPERQPEPVTYDNFRRHYRSRTGSVAGTLAALVRRFPDVARQDGDPRG